MSNLTITTDEQILKKARLRAISEGTSVNAVLREFLELYAGTLRGRSAAIKDILSISESTDSRRGDNGWTRDELHEREN